MNSDTLKEVKIPKPEFLSNYRDANFFSRIFFHYCHPLIVSINKNKGEMTEAMIEDMTTKDGETDRQTEAFQKKIKDGFNAWSKENPGEPDSKAPWYKIVRNAVFSIFGCEFILCAFLILISEGLALGLKLVAIYASAVFVSTILRN